MGSEKVTVAIGVPVRDEEAMLPDLLGALADLDLTGVTAVACFQIDSCRDGSAAVLREAAGDFPLPLLIEHGPMRTEANAGRARAAAMAQALAATTPGSVLLSTDADSRPRRDWVQAALSALAASDVVAGRIERTQADAHQARVERYYDRLHAHRRTVDPVEWDAGGCHHGGGANLGVRADVYRRLGGFAPVPAGEDARLLDDAARAGFRVRREPAMVVETSSRREGRAPGGLAASLRALDATGLPRVQHPSAAAWQWARHAEARAAFAQLDAWAVRERLGAVLGLTADHVLGVGRDCPNAEAFAMRVVPAPPGGDRMVPLAEAEAALAALERAPCRGAA